MSFGPTPPLPVSSKYFATSGLMPAFATTPMRRNFLASSSALTAVMAGSVCAAFVTSKTTASNEPSALIASTSDCLRTVTMAV
eukprot:CAMPEP_0119078462 /NCGR_PEP_ID=MMETSP1178-20130426/101020_1 /TAXON_ID=33656 /ORGANISM="unid sp, Strain CCMP2000" /LENGTH=82 /DNA_ID=CAMNT_0007060911 /DNA_START=8 /DNA_END=256 /DNA_ORIENTATION=+